MKSPSIVSLFFLFILHYWEYVQYETDSSSSFLWELLALSAFILVIFEHEKPETIKAGLNFLVQSHISIVFIMLGFIYVAFKTGSYGFDAIIDFVSFQSTGAGIALFMFSS